MSASPTLTSTSSSISTGLSPSDGILYLSASALIVLLICVVVAFEYGRKMQRTNLDTQRLRDAVSAEEKQKLNQQLDNDKWNGPLDIKNNPLPMINLGQYSAYYFWQNQDAVLSTPDTPPSNQAEVDKWKKLQTLKKWGTKENQIWNSKTAEIDSSTDPDDVKRARRTQLSNISWAGPIDNSQNPLPANLDSFYNVNYFWSHLPEVLSLPDEPPINQDEVDNWKKLHSLKDWGQREVSIYNSLKASYPGRSEEIAKKLVPQSSIFDQSGGFTFVLEFCTIMVIIFTLVILGLLGVLPGNEISAILAAVAGYVLGRSASTAQQSRSGTTQQGQVGTTATTSQQSQVGTTTATPQQSQGGTPQVEAGEKAMVVVHGGSISAANGVTAYAQSTNGQAVTITSIVVKDLNGNLVASLTPASGAINADGSLTSIIYSGAVTGVTVGHAYTLTLVSTKGGSFVLTSLVMAT